LYQVYIFTGYLLTVSALLAERRYVLSHVKTAADAAEGVWSTSTFELPVSMKFMQNAVPALTG
jgi:hypothetical protein